MIFALFINPFSKSPALKDERQIRRKSFDCRRKGNLISSYVEDSLGKVLEISR
jgi:hypothetical protein